jgi:hypothetical protein
MLLSGGRCPLNSNQANARDRVARALSLTAETTTEATLEIAFLLPAIYTTGTIPLLGYSHFSCSPAGGARLSEHFPRPITGAARILHLYDDGTGAIARSRFLMHCTTLLLQTITVACYRKLPAALACPRKSHRIGDAWFMPAFTYVSPTMITVQIL